MSFDLRITFTGLCMFVPDPDPDETQGREPGGASPQMHVLLPHMDGHQARLVYDSAYERQNQDKFDRHLRCVCIEPCVMQVLGFSDGGIDLRLPDEIASIDGALKSTTGCVPPANVGWSPGPGVKTRVTVDAGCVSDYAVGAFFDLAGTQVQMTYLVDWTIREIEQDWLDECQFYALNHGPYTSIPRLFPIRDSIHLFVYNVPVEELPPIVPAPPDPMINSDHFQAYYDLVLLPAGSAHAPIPPVALSGADFRWAETSDCPPHAVHKEDPRGTIYTCMVSQATLAR